MSLINVANLTFSYSGNDNIFENASFQLDTDWKLGFIGRNGRGKTTFLKLLMGSFEYSGIISASVKFEYFPYEVSDALRDTIDVVRGICDDFEQWELDRELSMLEVDKEVLFRPFNTLSGGERTKVLLAALFLKQNSFLLIDEPTNHIDHAARKILGNYLSGKKGFILVSHDRALLNDCIDHVLSINRANIDVQKGNFSKWLENKRLRDSFEMAENERLKSDIKKLGEAAKRTACWSDRIEKTKRGKPGRDQCVKPDKGYIGHKSAKMMKRSKVIETRRENAAEEKAGLLKNIEKTETLAIKPLEYHSYRLLELKNVSVAYGSKTVCEGVNFEICRGDRLAVAGRNGSGKSSILKLIIGSDISYTGELKIGRITISHVPQDTSFLEGHLKSFIEFYKLDETLFKAILRKLGFSREQFDKDMHDFSEGQKKKALIAKSLCERAHLYVWDEPLNFIDVISRMQIESLILEYKPTMIFVEHDSEFVKKIATTSITI